MKCGSTDYIINTLFNWLIVWNYLKSVDPGKISRQTILAFNLVEKYVKVITNGSSKQHYEKRKCCYCKSWVSRILWKSGSQLISNKHLFSSVIYKLYLFKNLVCFPIYVIFIGSIYYFKCFVTITIIYSNVHQCWGIKYLTDNKHIFTSFRYCCYNVVLIIITIIIIN